MASRDFLGPRLSLVSRLEVLEWRFLFIAIIQAIRRIKLGEVNDFFIECFVGMGRQSEVRKD